MILTKVVGCAILYAEYLLLQWEKTMSEKREHFATRLGFIFMTAGCAFGLGNVWRFPYVTGANGGALFVLFYIGCLVLFGLPVLMMELALGRAGQSTYPGAFEKLQNPQVRFKWKIPAYVFISGNLILLMFYSVVTGWVLFYTVKFFIRDEKVWDPELFGRFLASPGEQTLYMAVAVIITAVICIGGVKKVIEKSIKVMMAGLFLLLGVLVFYAFTMPNASEGIKFFLAPDFSSVTVQNIPITLNAALAQAFFTLSIGIGSVSVCGSYMNKERSLFQEGLWIILLDTIVAVASGLIIFPCCAAFGVSPDAGPELIFVTLTKVFSNMQFPYFWGGLFFIFLFVAALSTLIAVFENLTAFGMDEFKWSREKSCGIFFVVLLILSMPCILGFNYWQNFEPFGKGSNILDLEDFIVSANLLPIGSLYLTLFCMYKAGWGSDNFFAEMNTGKGWKFPVWMRHYIRIVIPAVVFIVWLAGIVEKFF